MNLFTNDDNSIIQQDAQATLNELVNAIECLTVSQAAAITRLIKEQEEDAISMESVALITGLHHLQHTIRNASVACYEQFQAELRKEPRKETRKEVL